MQEQAKTEAEMRDANVAHPKNFGELVEYLKSLVEREHDYGTAVYAISMGATAMIHLMRKLEKLK